MNSYINKIKADLAEVNQYIQDDLKETEERGFTGGQCVFVLHETPEQVYHTTKFGQIIPYKETYLTDQERAQHTQFLLIKFATIVETLKKRIVELLGTKKMPVMPPRLVEMLDEIPEKFTGYICRFLFGDWSTQLLSRDEYDFKNAELSNETPSFKDTFSAEFTVFVFEDQVTVVITGFQWIAKEPDDGLLYHRVIEDVQMSAAF